MRSARSLGGQMSLIERARAGDEVSEVTARTYGATVTRRMDLDQGRQAADARRFCCVMARDESGAVVGRSSGVARRDASWGQSAEGRRRGWR